MLAGSITSLLVALSGSNLRQVVFWSMGSFLVKAGPMLYAAVFIICSIPLISLSRELSVFLVRTGRVYRVSTKKVKFVPLILIDPGYISVAVGGTIGL